MTNFLKNIDLNDKFKTIDILYDNIDFIKQNINTNSKIIIKDYDDLNKINDDNIIISCHKIILYLLNNLFIKELDSQKEYVNLKHLIKYKILIANTEPLRKLFTLFVLIYALEVYNITKKYYIGIDYEYHKGKDIRLMQINFERQPIKNEYISSYIWIIKPPDLNSDMTNILLKYLMTNDKIYKIMQGTDALDIPYMIKELFNNDAKIIKKFFSRFVDLRYICEFYKANWGKEDNKCDIYTAYLYFNVIDKKKHKLLMDSNEIVLEPLRSFLWEKTDGDDIWDINKMDEAVLYYAVFDVIYLKYHLFNILKMSRTHDNFITAIKLIPMLTQFCMFEKHNITTITNDIKKIVDPINNYYFYLNNKIIKLIDVYKYYVENLILDDLNINIANLFKVNYFRNYLMYLLKIIIFSILCHKFKVFISKNNIYNIKYDITKLTNIFNDTNFKKLNILFLSIHNNINSKLNELSNLP